MVIHIRKRTLAVGAAVLLAVFLASVVLRALSLETVTMAGASGAEEVRLPAIMYHQLTDSAARAGDYVLTAEQFEADMRYIQSRGYTSVTTQQLIDYAEGTGELPEKPILITFDDGYESFVPYALPVLQELDMYAVISIIGSVAQTYTDKEDHTLRYSHLSWDGIGELSRDPHVEIGNHTYNLHKLDAGRKGCRIKPGEEENSYKAMLKADLTQTQELVQQHTGYMPKTFAYPFGARCSQAGEVLREMGFQVVLTCAERVNHIQKGNSDWLFSIGRFNRPSGRNSEQFFEKILV